jgi:predicted ATPase
MPVPLRGLGLDEVGDFVRSGGDISADPKTVSSLRQATGGNPFFLDEIVRLMIAEREHGGPMRPRASFTIPDSIRAAIDRRIRPLSDRTKSLLTLASVIGNEFDFGLLYEAAELPRPQLFESLGEAGANAIIVEPAQPTEPYRFAHATVAETLRSGLGLTARAQLHQQVAMAVERLHQGHLAPHFAQLAHHYVEALSIGDAGKAVEYSRRGAEWARRQLAFAEAVRL